MQIEILSNIAENECQQIQKLMSQLSSSPKPLSVECLNKIIGQEQSKVFAAKDDDGIIAGILLVAWYEGLSSNKVWIEDVVVDSDYRGKGIGRLLVQNAIDFIKENINEGKIMLTSRVTRVAAHALYKSLGFKEYNTGVFVLQ